MVGPECRNCYAMWVAAVRMSKPGQAYHGLAELTPAGLAKWTGKVVTVPDKLDQPLRWRRPRLVFVNSMSDLFHESLTDEQIDAVVGMMALADWHTFQVLTKRSQRLPIYLAQLRHRPSIVWAALNRKALADPDYPMLPCLPVDRVFLDHHWPLPNVWWGVSAGMQETFDSRMRDLAAAKWNAAVIWLSMEPLLERVVMVPPYTVEFGTTFPDWVVVGGESDSRGGEARPMNPDWVRWIRDWCQQHAVPFHFKQWGSWAPVTHYEMPNHYMADDGLVYTLAADQLILGGRPAFGKIGKTAAGRVLDGRVWQEWPAGFEGPAAEGAADVRTK